MTKIVQYTTNIGSYDPPRKDLLNLEYDLFRNNARNSRAVKILSHKFIECDISIYWDANMFCALDLTSEQIVKKYLCDYDIAVHRSSPKGCVYEEIEAALRSRVVDPQEREILIAQGEYYKSIGIPKHIGTLAGYQPLIRRHNDRIKRFNEDWWSEMCRWSYRDQVSFPVVLQRHPDLKVNWTDLSELGRKSHRHAKFIHPKIQ